MQPTRHLFGVTLNMREWLRWRINMVGNLPLRLTSKKSGFLGVIVVSLTRSIMFIRRQA